MSYKDLEQQLKGLIDDWAAKEQAKADAKAEKKARQAKKKRPPMFKPDKPIKYSYTVTLLVRQMTHRVWGDETQTVYVIEDTISKDEAQVIAVHKANADGLAVVGIASIIATE